MVQQTFTDMEYANRKRTTRWEAFLDAMESIIPWKEWMKLIAPYYVQKERGRKLISLETMLRMYLMQNWFGLSDEGIEDAIYDSYAMKGFLKIDFSTEQTPDATTLLHFRHLLEKHDIAQTHALIREDDHIVYGDSGYLGVEKRTEIRETLILSDVDYHIAKRPSQNRMTKGYKGTNWDRVIGHAKASVRSKVGHPFLIVKRMFHAGKTRYRGLRKNLLQFYLLFASENLVMCLRAGRQREFCMTMG
jgi:ISPssy, transposase